MLVKEDGFDDSAFFQERFATRQTRLDATCKQSRDWAMVTITDLSTAQQVLLYKLYIIASDLQHVLVLHAMIDLTEPVREPVINRRKIYKRRKGKEEEKCIFFGNTNTSSWRIQTCLISTFLTGVV